MDIRNLAAKLGMLGGHVSILDDKTLISKEKEGYKLYRILNTGGYRSSEPYEFMDSLNGTELVRVSTGKNTGLLYRDMEVAVKPRYNSIRSYGGSFIALSDKSVTSIWVNRNRT